MRYLLLIYGPEPTEDTPPEAIAAEMADYNTFTAGRPRPGRLQRRRGAPADGDGDDGPGPRRPDARRPTARSPRRRRPSAGST